MKKVLSIHKQFEVTNLLSQKQISSKVNTTPTSRIDLSKL
jgi:hypothetical protein